MPNLIASKILIYTVVILIGFIGKKLNVFKKEHTKFLNTIILNITLPAAIINGFKGVTITPILLISLLVGLISNTTLLFISLILGKNKSIKEKIIYIFALNSFNIGNLVIPFITGLISSQGFAAVCLFHIANTIMLYGVDVAIAKSINDRQGKISLVYIIKKVFLSPIFITQIVLIILNILNITLPSIVLDLTSTVGGANSFLAMLCIGILLEFKLVKSQWKIVFKVLIIRLVFLISICLILYFLIPISHDIKIAICVCLLAPVASAAPALSESNGGDGSVCAVINSISIPIGIALMSLFLLTL